MIQRHPILQALRHQLDLVTHRPRNPLRVRSHHGLRLLDRLLGHPWQLRRLAHRSSSNRGCLILPRHPLAPVEGAVALLLRHHPPPCPHAARSASLPIKSQAFRMTAECGLLPSQPIDGANCVQTALTTSTCWPVGVSPPRLLIDAVHHRVVGVLIDGDQPAARRIDVEVAGRTAERLGMAGRADLPGSWSIAKIAMSSERAARASIRGVDEPSRSGAPPPAPTISCPSSRRQRRLALGSPGRRRSPGSSSAPSARS